jgi:GNAT superfamily N-acetyltransferase
MEPVLQRAVEDRDASGLQRLIADAFADYPHCFLDVEMEEPELLAPALHFSNFQVLVQAGRIVGSVGCAQSGRRDGRPIFELKKLYLHAGLRGQGLGRKLTEWVESEARAAGAIAVELWSDTRFETAHRVYERMGYRNTGRERPLNDISDSAEFHFFKELSL